MKDSTKTAFGAEYHLAGRVDRIRKYETPVRVFADGSRADRKLQLAKVVADIAQRVRHLDIAMAETSDGANVLVKLVRDRDLFRTISTFYGSEPGRGQDLADPQCLSGFRKNDKFEIVHSDVILTVDNGDFVFLDCAYEELLQSLGPINDTSTVPWTMFNDNVSMGYFDVYDQYIMNVLYDPRIKAGMTVAEVKAVLPTCSPTSAPGCRTLMIWRSRVRTPGSSRGTTRMHLNSISNSRPDISPRSRGAIRPSFARQCPSITRSRECRVPTAPAASRAK